MRTTTQGTKPTTIHFRVPVTEESLGRITRAGLMTDADIRFENATFNYQRDRYNRWRDEVDIHVTLPANQTIHFATMAGLGFH